MKPTCLLLALAFMSSLQGAQAGTKAPRRKGIPEMVKTESGLRYADVRPGKGDSAHGGQQLGMLYRGWLYDTVKGRQGKLFDSDLNRKKPFEFTLGAGQVIKGWDEGVTGLKVGGKRVLIIPPELGYGDRGAKDEKGEFVIPPGATLLFEVEVVFIHDKAPQEGAQPAK